MNQSTSVTTPQPDDVAWLNLLLEITRIAVGLERQHSTHRVTSLYRRNIISNVRRALDPTVDLGELVKMPPSVDGTSVASLYRQALIINLPDWADALTAAEVLAAVQSILDAELAEREWPARIVPEPPDAEYRYELLDRSSNWQVTQGGGG